MFVFCYREYVPYRLIEGTVDKNEHARPTYPNNGVYGYFFCGNSHLAGKEVGMRAELADNLPWAARTRVGKISNTLIVVPER